SIFSASRTDAYYSGNGSPAWVSWCRGRIKHSRGVRAHRSMAASVPGWLSSSRPWDGRSKLTLLGERPGARQGGEQGGLVAAGVAVHEHLFLPLLFAARRDAHQSEIRVELELQFS